jgi:hypothetical protein
MASSHFKHTLGYYRDTGDTPIANTGGADAIFLVMGPVLLTMIWSEIAVAGAGGNCQWQYDPTTGTAAQAMCAVGAFGAGVAGDYLTIESAAGVNTLTVAGAIAARSPDMWILAAGTISFVSGGAAGTCYHRCTFIPLAEGSDILISP